MCALRERNLQCRHLCLQQQNERRGLRPRYHTLHGDMFIFTTFFFFVLLCAVRWVLKIHSPFFVDTAGFKDFLPRSQHAMAYDPVKDMVYITGGTNAQNVYLGVLDVLTYSFGEF